MTSETTPKTEQPQRREFQTEARQLLQLMIHSLYSHKEVFIRELVSNASDALDKLRFESLSNAALQNDGAELKISVTIDKTAKTITIADNGIGMTSDEVVQNIGTIARSGSRAFLEKLTGDQKADSNLIGKFGVGFYSVFMVASSVKLITKRAGSTESAVIWESDGQSDYTLNPTDKETSGTTITIYLKDEESEYAEDWKVRSIIKKYSDFIAFPIYMVSDKGKDEVVNETKPLWKRSGSEVTTEQYEEFFKQALGGFDKPLCTLHNKAEGVLEYSSLLFIPAKGGFDLFGFERKHGVKLYVKRVFITDDCKELIPEYLRFVKGVVDSEDLPLNVSREMLQHNPVIEKIKKAVVSRIIGKLEELATSEPATYFSFWQQFGQVLKEGVHIDHDNKSKIIDLLRFQSSMGATKDDVVSLKQYVARMRQDQKDIYYISGESRDVVEKSPHLEIFRAKSIEVLYFIDPIDEWIVNDIYNYDSKQLKSVTKGDLDLGELGKEEKETQKKTESKFKKFAERLKDILTVEVKDVRVTSRLKDSPACLVADSNDMGAQMERIMKSMGQAVPEQKRILEINPEHPVIANLKALFDKDSKSQQLESWTRLVFEQSLIAEGQMVPDPMAHVKRVNELLAKAASDLAA